MADTLPVNFIISITSQGYIPTFYKVCYIQGESISYDRVYDCDIAKVGNCLTNQTPIGDVVIKDGKTTINASDAIIYSITVEKGAELIINNKK